MLIGRFLFGLGGESIAVVSCDLVTKWFKNKELAFSMGIVF